MSGSCVHSSYTRSCAGATLAAIVIAAGVSSAVAQDIEPRAYSNAPVGVNFLVTAYAHSEGGLATDPSLALTNADLRIDTVVVGYARALDVWGRSGKFDVILPYSVQSGGASRARGRLICPTVPS